MTYAEDTKVAPERTLSEIQSILKRYGATKYALLDEGDSVAIAFEMKDRRCKMVLTLPKIENYKWTETGRTRTASVQRSEWEQACKSKYRSLLLVIKAKLESIESGIETFDQAFMAHIMLPNGRTVGEQLIPQVKDAYISGGMPTLQLASGGAQ